MPEQYLYGKINHIILDSTGWVESASYILQYSLTLPRACGKMAVVQLHFGDVISTPAIFLKSFLSVTKWKNTHVLCIGVT